MVCERTQTSRNCSCKMWEGTTACVRCLSVLWISFHSTFAFWQASYPGWGRLQSKKSRLVCNFWVQRGGCRRMLWFTLVCIGFLGRMQIEIATVRLVEAFEGHQAPIVVEGKAKGKLVWGDWKATLVRGCRAMGLCRHRSIDALRFAQVDVGKDCGVHPSPSATALSNWCGK